MTVNQKRWNVLDNLKAILVTFMITGHTLIWWYSQQSDHTMTSIDNPYYEPLLGLFFMGINALVMSLPLTAGMALYFSIKARKKISHKIFYTWLLSRTAIIYLIGLAVNYCAWGSRYLWTWDVLQFYAVSFFVLGFLLRLLPLIYTLAFGVIAIGLSQYQIESDLISSYLQVVLWGSENGEHFWPLFPWISIVIVGYAVSLVHDRVRAKFNQTLLFSAFSLGLLSLILTNSWYTIDLNNVWGASVFQPSLSTIFMQLALVLILIGGLDKQSSKKIGLISQSYSQGILLIYASNIILGYHFTGWLQTQIPNLVGLWLAILIQLIMAYAIGKGVIKLKTKYRSTVN